MVQDSENVTLDDVLQPGKNMLAAGYCMYGSSCTVSSSELSQLTKSLLLMCEFKF
jgi:fructose-1,6-bisphosphatase